MLHLRGTPARSAFRLEKLLAGLRQSVPDVAAVHAEYWHFAELTGELTDRDQSVFHRLLQYGPRSERSADPQGELFLVVPRVGTVSPWSTKATDIARRCGLHQLRRLERGVLWYVGVREHKALSDAQRAWVAAQLHDPMTESVFRDFSETLNLFDHSEPAPLATVDVLRGGAAALAEANRSLGLALSPAELAYLAEFFLGAERNPTDVELMMFAQVNSEHCRHKIFNADWRIDGEAQKHSLFGMIRETHRANGRGTLVAYADNSAVLVGTAAGRFFPDPATREYGFVHEDIHLVCKVETHNHPTAISPFPGAATGSGGEIRDEGATGTGAKPKAGLTGFSVSHLRIPGAERPWEGPASSPPRIASPLQIMLEGPIGGASFNNEFGRPNICGYFRTFEQSVPGGELDARRGYHKPIMVAGGLGNIRPQHVAKREIPPGAHIVVLGGPAMLIGLGGGAASSVASGASSEALDFASVQRGNAEMQRRCQEVIDQCWALGDRNPILSIHDIGAGGLSNALPELVHGSDRGGRFELRAVLNDDPGMSPMQIWCNEAQERYVLAVAGDRLADFEAICERERCLYCVVGEATEEATLRVHDRHFAARGRPYDQPIDLPMRVLFSEPPKMLRDVQRVDAMSLPLRLNVGAFHEALERVLSLPAVADKTFLISIGDRSVGGLVCRDPMVGPWQVPVADVAVTAAGFDTYAGEAMAMGERSPLALLDPAASARMAVAEALTNLAAAAVRDLNEVKLSANWMAAAGHPGEDAALFEAVRAIGLALCPALGVAVPVGKDSMSMKTVWRDDGGSHEVVAPVSLIVSAFAPVDDVRRTLTPHLVQGSEDTELLCIDLGAGRNRLGGSALGQVYSQLGQAPPDVDEPELVRGFWQFLQTANRAGWVLAYHDRSDGGLAVSLLEMAFATRCGLEIDLGPAADPLAAWFNEELGAVIQIRSRDRSRIEELAGSSGIADCLKVIGRPIPGDRIRWTCGDEVILDEARADLHRIWSDTTWRMQRLRDHPDCADEEHAGRTGVGTALHADLRFDPRDDPSAPYLGRGRRPQVAILREQGVNGQVEMAAAFHRAGFAAQDVTMSDLASGAVSLGEFHGLVACGGFSFGDVLGAGEGWAKSILFDPRMRERFEAYFARDEVFALGVCNGCQMLSNLKEIIPGSTHWPRFVANRSEQFEARLVMVEIAPSPSILLDGMAGSRLPVVVAHGEGRAEWAQDDLLDELSNACLVSLRYVDGEGAVTETYPGNPNGSPGGVTGLTNSDGRVTIMMPHPERVFRTVQHSFAPADWGEDAPWMRLFRNARAFVA